MASSAPWLAHYDPGVPPTLAPYPNRTLLDYISDHARERPAHPALLFKGAKVSYAELEAQSNACAAAFRALGIRRGDRVALLLPNCPQLVVAELGAWKVGAIAAPLNPIYTERELEQRLAENDIDTIVVMTRYYERVKRIQPRTAIRRVIATNIKEYFPPLLRALFTLFVEKREGDRVTLRPEDYDLASLLRRHAGDAFTREAITPDDPAILLMSGGTTGTPKGVLGRHSAYIYSGLQIVAWTKSVIEPWRDVILLPLPLFHVYANLGVQPLSLINGQPIALVPNPRDLKDLLATVRRTRPAVFIGVPTLYIGMLNRPEVRAGKIDFKSIKLCISGAAALLAETKQRFETLTGGRILEGYSLTEAMMALCVNPMSGPNKIGSVGMPLPDVHVGIFDTETGTRMLGITEIGEIAFSAPQLMIGFWNHPEETALVLRDHVEADGTTRHWLHTGDIGYLDEDGYVFIVDRKKDLIKTSGYQVWPREVEEVLAMHPAVVEAGVAGIADPVKGEAVHAWVVLRSGTEVSEQDLRAFCREKLAPYKVPSRIEFRPDLPKTLVGKVMRRALREESK